VPRVTGRNELNKMQERYSRKRIMQEGTRRGRKGFKRQRMQ